MSVAVVLHTTLVLAFVGLTAAASWMTKVHRKGPPACRSAQTPKSMLGGVAWALFSTSALAVIKVVALGCVGALLAHKGILTPNGRNVLSQLLFYCFIPAVSFTYLAEGIDLKNLVAWWPLPFNVFFSIVVGAVLGWVLAVLPCARTPRHLRKHVIVCSALANVGNLPLVLVTALCETRNSPVAAGLQGHCTNQGWSYVTFSMWVASFIHFTLAYHMLRPAAGKAGGDVGSAQKDGYPIGDVANGVDVSLVGGDSRSHFMPANGTGLVQASSQNRVLQSSLVTWPQQWEKATAPPLAGRGLANGKRSDSAEGWQHQQSQQQQQQQPPPALELAALQEGYREQRFELQASASESGDEEGEPEEVRGLLGSSRREAALPQHAGDVTSGSGRKLGGRGGSRLWWRQRFHIVWHSMDGMTLSQVLPLPACASIFGLIVGCIAPVKGLLFGTAPPLGFVTESLLVMGGGMIPCMLLLLGAVLFKGPGSGKVPARTVIAVVIGRIILMPAIGTVLVASALRSGLVTSPNPLYSLIMFLDWTTPTALNMSTVAALHRNGEEEIGALLFWQYLASVLTLPCFLMLHLYLAQHYLP